MALSRGVKWKKETAFMRYLVVGAALFSMIGATACAPLVVGAGATGGVMAAQDRGLEQGVDDNEIAFEINRKLADKDPKLFNAVSTQVSGGRVVLIGTVSHPEDRVTAVKVVHTVGGVKEVIDELKLGEPRSFSERTDDTMITTKLRAAITGDNRISSINYSIATIRGTVYLMGVAQDRAELDRVIAHARAISGVRNVITNATVKVAAAAQR